MNDGRVDIKTKGDRDLRDGDYSRIAWRFFKRDKLAVAALWIIVLMFILSYLAPVLANNKPLIMRMKGRTYFPAIVELFPLKYVADYPDLRSFDFSRMKGEDAISLLMPPVPYSPYETNLADKLEPPSRHHLMGTDDLGRDVCSRMIHGAGDL